VPISGDKGSLETSGGSGLGRSQTLSRREIESFQSDRTYSTVPESSNLQPSDQQENFVDAVEAPPMPMSAAQGKLSTDGGQHGGALDRFTQRRLQRLQTESAFRETRQTGNVQSPNDMNQNSQYNHSANSQKYNNADAQPQSLHQSPQVHPTAPPSQSSYRTSQASQALSLDSNMPGSRQNSFPQENIPTTQHSQSSHLQQSRPSYSPHDAGEQFSTQDPTRPALNQQQSRSYNHNAHEDMSNNGTSTMTTTTKTRPPNNNRQSVHNVLISREASSVSSQGGQPSLPSNTGAQPRQSTQQGDVARVTSQLAQASDEMTDEEVAQLQKDHKELRRYPVNAHRHSPH
jgi:hypothetical protein